jgi:5-methyltetrahydrofolate--homocysteine methyltransferase
VEPTSTGVKKIEIKPYLIAERLNSSIPPVFKLMEAEDAEALKTIVRKQVAAGASAIDLNVDIFRSESLNKLQTLYELIREECDLSVSIDSSDEHLIKEFIASHPSDPFVLNSISVNTDIANFVFDYLNTIPDARAIIRMDVNGFPPANLAEYEKAYTSIRDFVKPSGLPLDRFFIDLMIRPVAMTQEIFIESLAFLDSISDTDASFIVGLSNVSFGLPRRKMLNAFALATLWTKGIRNYILNVSDSNIMGALTAMKALTGLDSGCLDYCMVDRG